jgi:hypothetical protein
MSLETKSQELKDLVSTYDTQWFLGEISGLMKNIATGRANDQLGELSSPMRQLYFLGGLLVSSDFSNGIDIMYNPEKWKQIVVLLNEIEAEYDKLFFPSTPEEVNEQWRHVRKVAMPSFLSYFNQGPLNYEEQTINWTRDLFNQLDTIIEPAVGLKTDDFIQFYETLDQLNQKNFQSHSTKHEALRPDWKKYTKIVMGFGEGDNVPEFIKEMGEKNRPLYTFMADHGIIDRFYPEEIVSANLPIEKVQAILQLLATTRNQTDYLYYTATKPGNPLYEKPIVDIGDGMFQVFEVKQVIHSIDKLLENICSSTTSDTTKLIEKKGKLLEERIVELFKSFFKKDYEVHTGYYVDGCEQDILFLWKEYAFIIEAKGYKLNEPFRDPDKAFVRIKNDFKSCIGYGYSQTNRVEQKFVDQVPLRITDKNGNLINEIDTTKYENNDFSIIVNLKSFGQIQNDLATLLEVDEDDAYPWAVKLDDLEVFLLTLVAQKKKPLFFIDYLIMRENLHGKLICSDELEVCGGFISGKIYEKTIEKADLIVTTPDLASLFDNQYNKIMGFKNEKYVIEKKSGKYIFW